MPLSPNIENYSHIRTVLDAAVALGGGTVECDTPQAAVMWRLQAHTFKKLYREKNSFSNYERLVLVLEKGSCTITIKERSPMDVVFRAPSGEVVDPTAEALEVDPLLEEALKLAKEIDG